MILSRNSFHSGFLLLAVLGTSTLPARTQQPSQFASGPTPVRSGKLTFDVASVRVSSRKFVLIGADFLNPVSNSAPPTGGLFSWNVQLGWLIDFAYDLRSPQLRQDLWTALPKPAQDEWYAIEARADGTPTRADVRQMVRSLLEDRFQFKGHLEKRDGQVLLLEVAKPGLGLKPHTEGAPCTLPSALMDENKYPHAYPPYKNYAPRCGVFNRELSHVGERRFEMLDVTMQQIADSLNQQFTVMDHTGLEGHYDAVLDFGPNGVPQNPDTSDELGLPPIPSALEKQLGLKLVKQSAQVDVFVTDHIGTLTEN